MRLLSIGIGIGIRERYSYLLNLLVGKLERCTCFLSQLRLSLHIYRIRLYKYLS
jgi:hypothetical protein